MSYTFTQIGSEIQAILDRAEAGGQIDQDIAAKAPLASPALTGDPTAPTQSEGDNSAKLATTAYADRAARDAASAAYPTDSVSGDVVGFPDGASNIPVKSFVGSIIPAQSGSGDPSPSNVRPISGWTGAKITRAGKNLLDKSKTIVERAISNTGSLTTNARCASATEFIYVGSTATVTVSASSSLAYIYLACYDETQTFISRISTSSTASHAFNLPSGTRWLKWCINYDNTTTVTQAIVDGLNLQLELGSSASAYEAYQADTILLDFGQTVYAGTLTALGGGKWSIQPTHAVVDMGSLTWVYNNSYSYPYFQCGVPDDNIDYDDEAIVLSCSIYKPVAGATGARWRNNSYPFSIANLTNQSASSRIGVQDSNYTDAATFKSAVTGQTLLYPLATLPAPIIVTAEELTTLLGANTVWQSCGAVTELEYRADTALYVQKLIGGGTLSTLSMSAPAPSLSLGRVDVLAEPEEETEQTEPEADAEPAEEAAEQTEADTEEATEE